MRRWQVIGIVAIVMLLAACASGGGSKVSGSNNTTPSPSLSAKPRCAPSSADLAVTAKLGLPQDQLAALRARLARLKYVEKLEVIRHARQRQALICLGFSRSMVPTDAQLPMEFDVWLTKGAATQHVETVLAELPGVDKVVPRRRGY